MEEYKTLRVKESIARKFQEFSKKNFKTHSEALSEMLEFFTVNQISPKENFGKTGRTLENLIKKRISAVIAIIRDIEKNQTKPTLAMLQALFQSDDGPQKPKLTEKNIMSESKSNSEKQQ